MELATRERILSAALELFAERGYQRASVREIADRVGITKAAVHYHFPNKIDILLHFAEPVWRDFETVLEKATADGIGAAARGAPHPAWPLIEGWLDVMIRHRAVFLILLNNPAPLVHEPTYSRVLRLWSRAGELIAGPDTTLGGRVRAAQVLSTLGDPLVFFAQYPPDDLRREILAGVRLLLGPEAPPEPQPHAAHDAGGGSGVARGRRGPGRPKALSAEARQLARRLHAEGRSADEIARELSVSRATVYRYLSA